jgi:hypothetical protein
MFFSTFFILNIVNTVVKIIYLILKKLRFEIA